METFIGYIIIMVIIYFWIKNKDEDDVTYYDKNGNKTGSKRYKKRR